MKRRVLVILLALSLILILVYHNSYSIALKMAGLSEKSISYIHTGFDDNGNEYRVVFQFMPDNMVKIARLTKDNWGVWHTTDEASGPDTEDYITIGWMRFSGFRLYDANDHPITDCEVHRVYGGNNAVKQIEIPTDLLPPNTAVNVFQSGARYVIHFVSYGEAETLNQINIIELLEQTDSISTTDSN